MKIASIVTRISVVLAATLLVAGGGCTRSLEPGMGSGGLSRDGLQEVTEVLQEAVDRGDVGGIVTLIHRRGEIVQVDAVGHRDAAKTSAMARDSIFRIASMTKPITSVAALILLDEGRFDLLDPIDPWLPELAQLDVLPDPAAPLEARRPATRPIRVIDLLTHRSGIVTPRNPPGPLLDALTEADANNGAGHDVWLATIGELPLAHEPGTTFDYGNSVDVLGILVERVSGQPLPDFMRERIFEPLGMSDTAFWIPPEKRDRAAPLQDLGRVPASWIPSHTEVPGFVSAAGGLYSTVDDYLKFARMLLGGGRLGDVRILDSHTVDRMTTNQLPEAQRQGLPFGGPPDYWAGLGFGLGLAVQQDAAVGTRELGIASVGSFGWPGVFGTWWQADPAQEMILIFMVPGGDAKPSRWAFQAAAYRALVD
jgi:CubicO group peptidase (beta-lactamase class C family)